MRVHIASSVDLLLLYANWSWSRLSFTYGLSIFRTAFSKHLDSTDVRVIGLRSLSVAGKFFFGIGTILPIFHIAGKVDVFTAS
jgi:hypothetical protein